jgi:hypothetical protein
MYYVVALYLTNRITASNARFRAGSSFREAGGTLHPASQLFAHPLFDPYTIDFEVAVAWVSDNVFANLNLQKKKKKNSLKWVQTRLVREKVWFTI